MGIDYSPEYLERFFRNLLLGEQWDLRNRYLHIHPTEESGEVHLSEAIRKIQIPSEKWDEQGILMYNMDAIIAVGYRVNS